MEMFRPFRAQFSTYPHLGLAPQAAWHVSPLQGGRLGHETTVPMVSPAFAKILPMMRFYLQSESTELNGRRVSMNMPRKRLQVAGAKTHSPTKKMMDTADWSRSNWKTLPSCGRGYSSLRGNHEIADE